MLNGKIESHKGLNIQEYQFFDISTDSVKTLKENLFDINDQTKYNPEYWKKFNLILRDNLKN